MSGGTSTLTSLGKRGKGLYDSLKKSKDYYDRVKAIVDQETRSGAFFKEAIDGVTKLADKVPGSNLASHPYFKLHKVYLEVIEGAMNSVSALDRAVATWDRATASAIRLQTATSLAATYLTQLKGLILQYTLRHHNSLKAIGHDDLESPEQVLSAFYDWTGTLEEHASNALSLLIMVQIETRGVQELMAEARRTAAKPGQEKGGKGIAGSLAQIGFRSRQKEAQWAVLNKRAGTTEMTNAVARAYPEKAVLQVLEMVDRVTSRSMACAAVACTQAARTKPTETLKNLELILQKG